MPNENPEPEWQIGDVVLDAEGDVWRLSYSGVGELTWFMIGDADDYALDTPPRPLSLLVRGGKRTEVVRDPKNDRAPVQADHDKPAGSVTWAEHEQAWQAYAARHGHNQSAERIAERGGFGYHEMSYLLGRKPETWEAGRG